MSSFCLIHISFAASKTEPELVACLEKILAQVLKELLSCGLLRTRI